ncbi:tellurite resistance protein TehA-like permease [Nitrosomonas nitrosa]|uniref:tellurite resistance/C4-dicarboxylate transporter family protein n=1 Tax=Nitrosomonas nitrosa TaxID=52442 RepID=UPI000D3259D4|nr:tellurite resistance/C4-dicarboxylate transporter family protein [Nitrosomonas nitrosa]PTR02114.1 tellurite resistance protein TehA-like permease [Nitrosomonas nitrosa]
MKLLNAIIDNGIRDFHPAYFAMIMATGIVSIAFEAIGFPAIAKTLFGINLLFYPAFCGLLAARGMIFWPKLLADFRTLRRALLFLTFVVGTNTIGMQLIYFYQATGLAMLLWSTALVSWFGCIYFITHCFFAIRDKPIYEIVNGVTLLLVVSTTSVSLLGIRLLDSMGINEAYAYCVVGGFWLTGFVLYLIIITMLIYRMFFRQFEIAEWDAPYWICMGAAAIITLAGSEFIIRMPEWEDIRMVVMKMTVFIWFLGTLWIPYLLLMDIRKFIRVNAATSTPLWIKMLPWSRLAFGKQHYAYDPPAWSRVFPMGMYTASTLFLGQAAGIEYLAIISQYWGWFALLIWFLTFMGMLRAVIHTIRLPTSKQYD